MYEISPIRNPIHIYGREGSSEKYIPCSTGNGVTDIFPHESIWKGSEGSKEYHIKDGISPPPVAAFASIIYGNIRDIEARVSGEVYMGIWSCTGANVLRKVRDLRLAYRSEDGAWDRPSRNTHRRDHELTEEPNVSHASCNHTSTCRSPNFGNNVIAPSTITLNPLKEIQLNDFPQSIMIVLWNQPLQLKKSIPFHTWRRLDYHRSACIPPRLIPWCKRYTENSSRLLWSWPRDILCILLSDPSGMQSTARRLKLFRSGIMKLTGSSCSQHDERYCTRILSFIERPILQTAHRHRSDHWLRIPDWVHFQFYGRRTRDCEKSTSLLGRCGRYNCRRDRKQFFGLASRVICSHDFVPTRDV